MNNENRVRIAVTRLARVIQGILIVTAVLVPVFLLLSIGQIGDGAWEMQVRVKSASGLRIKHARGLARDDEAEAHAIAANPKTRIEDPHSVFDGETLSMSILYSSGTCCLDLVESRPNPPRFLAVIVEYPDGRRASKVVEIPEFSCIQRIEVEFP